MGELFIIVIIVTAAWFIIAFKDDFKSQGVSGKDGCLIIIAILVVAVFITICLLGASA